MYLFAIDNKPFKNRSFSNPPISELNINRKDNSLFKHENITILSMINNTE